jgi:hypothetical protein
VSSLQQLSEKMEKMEEALPSMVHAEELAAVGLRVEELHADVAKVACLHIYTSIQLLVQ